MFDSSDLITRRAALRRAAAILGGALSAPTVAGVLAGCDRSSETAASAWVPRTLTPEQSEMVLTMGEHLIPETDTPGARAARVNEFIDAMLTDYYPEQSRTRFLEGLGRVEARAQRVFGRPYAELSPDEKLALTTALNRAAYPEAAQPAGASEEVDPLLQEGDVSRGDERAAPLDSDWDPLDRGRRAFFRTVKELTLVGYYTSEVGSTRELGVNPMGSWRADIPYSEIGHAWA